MSKYAGFSLAYICVCNSLGAARWVALTSVARDGLHLKSLTSKLSLHFGVLCSLFLSEAPMSHLSGIESSLLWLC